MSSWYQTELIQREVLEIRIRLGVVPEADHVQVLTEALDPRTGVLVAQWSAPHGRLDAWMDLLEEAYQQARAYVAENVEPF